MTQEFIEIKGARENNLKNVSLKIPKREITLFTGVSGSGKSSLVFDTIAMEAQRLLAENFSTFLRGFMPRKAVFTFWTNQRRTPRDLLAARNSLTARYLRPRGRGSVSYETEDSQSCRPQQSSSMT